MTSQFQSAYAISSQPTELVNLCLNQIDLEAGPFTLGFIYLSDALARDFQQILDLLRKETGIQDWAGSLGVALCCDDREIYDSAALSIMLTDLDPTLYRLMPTQQHSVDTFFDEHSDWITEHGPRVAVVHGDPSNSAVPVLVEDMSAKMGEGFLTGALTSSQSDLLQVSGDIGQGGLSGTMFSGSLSIFTGHTQGCSPFSGLHTVTECHRNVISQIDGRPALDVLKEDVGEVLARDLNRLGGYIFAGLPVRGSDTGDYMVRNLLGIDSDRDIIAIGDLVDEGDSILFCRRDGNTAREDMVRMLENMKSRVGEQTIRGALYHSCLGRGRYQFGDNSEELKLITEVLGEIPLTGFFANGEIFHNRIYGYTGVLTLFV